MLAAVPTRTMKPEIGPFQAHCPAAQPEPGIRDELEALLQRYFTYLLERQLNSPIFIKQIQNGS